MDCDTRWWWWNTNTPYSTWRQFYLSAQMAHAVRAQQDKAPSSTPCGFMETQTSTSTHAQSHHQMREVSFMLQLFCLQKTSPNCPVNMRLGGFHSTTKSLTWINEYSVGLLIVLKCNVRDMFVYDWLELLHHTEEILGSNVEASYPIARYLWWISVPPGKWLDSASI